MILRVCGYYDLSKLPDVSCSRGFVSDFMVTRIFPSFDTRRCVKSEQKFTYLRVSRNEASSRHDFFALFIIKSSQPIKVTNRFGQSY